MKIRGYIYWIFPVDYDTKTEEVGMANHWLNNRFMWLFEFLNDFEGMVCDMFDWNHLFRISFRKKNKDKIKKIKNRK